MKKSYYLIGVMVLALAALGIYSSHAQSNADTPDEVLIIEESESVVPAQNDTTSQNQETNDENADFQSLPEDQGVEVAPAPIQDNIAASANNG